MFNYIYIEITNICQFNCSFCPKTKRPKREMTLEEFSHILKEIKPFTNNIYLHVLGEPLMHRKLEAILNLCETEGFTVHITTNGALIKEKEEILLKFKNIRKMNFSLHSAEDVNHLNLAVDSYLDNIFNFANKMINNDTTILYRLWDTNLSKRLILDKINAYYDKDLTNLKSSLGGTKLSDKIFLSQDDLFEWPIKNLEKAKTNGRCLGLKTHIAILVDGTVVPCCLDSEGKISLGNIYEQSLKDILASSKAEAIKQGFRDNKAIHPMCQTCTFKNRFKK